jgi:hypothetical protein
MVFENVGLREVMRERIAVRAKAITTFGGALVF